MYLLQLTVMFRGGAYAKHYFFEVVNKEDILLEYVFTRKYYFSLSTSKFHV